MTAKVKFQKLHLSESNIQKYLNLLLNLKMPFTLTISNYTTRIESENYNVFFMKTAQSNRVFIAAQMIKKDIKNCNPPYIDMEKNIYYDLNCRQDFFSEKVFNIDIKNCYATLLRNGGYISEKTHRYISLLPKKDRLAAIGMLASHKQVFKHNSKGEVIDYKEIISPLTPYFYWCVQTTQNIIIDCKLNIIKDFFLFSWVDGIYYNSEHYKNIIQKHLLDEYNLTTSYKELTNFEVKKKPNKFYIQFYENNRLKYFNIPLPDNQFRRSIANYLLTKKYTK